MTVGELVEVLRKFPPERLVLTDGYESGYDNPKIVERTVKYEPTNWYNGRYIYYEGGDPAVVIARP